MKFGETSEVTEINFKLKIVAVVDYKEWEDAEKAWINYYRRIGMIYNISPGGK